MPSGSIRIPQRPRRRPLFSFLRAPLSPVLPAAHLVPLGSHPLLSPGCARASRVRGWDIPVSPSVRQTPPPPPPRPYRSRAPARHPVTANSGAARPVMPATRNSLTAFPLAHAAHELPPRAPLGWHVRAQVTPATHGLQVRQRQRRATRCQRLDVVNLQPIRVTAASTAPLIAVKRQHPQPRPSAPGNQLVIAVMLAHATSTLSRLGAGRRASAPAASVNDCATPSRARLPRNFLISRHEP